MNKATLQVEMKLWRKGYRRVACLDEVGRGSLAGPVAACAVMIENSKFEYRNSKQILNSNFLNSKRVLDFGFRTSDLRLRDSKKLSQKARTKLYKILTSHPNIKWGIGKVYPKTIDRINILKATKLAMKRAVNNLKLKTLNSKIGFLILDGNMELDLPIQQKAIIKADEKVVSCAIASIIAKVKRDRAMLRYHKKYPQYGFDLHKGYGTKYHLKTLRKFGPCKIHRKSFRPVRGVDNST